MGDCKNQVTPSKDDKNGKKSVKEILGFKKKEIKPVEDDAEKFADMISRADEKLATLIITKRAELAAEKGDEAYNRRALGVLETMGYHLDAIANLGSEYVDLRK